jgi:amino acid adenylation domain-containing protein
MRTKRTTPSLFRPSDFVPYPKSGIDQDIPARFRAQARLYPTRTAVSDGKDSMTYSELEISSNQIANSILAARGDREEPIAFLFETGAAAVACILGILKAGKIYVALDPSTIREQLERIVADCTPSIILTNVTNIALARALAVDGTLTLSVDKVDPNANEVDTELRIPPSRRCYIYYTSGSTGTPKGVVDNHRNVLHNVMRYTNSLGISASDRLSLIQSWNFSGTVSTLFASLLNGATVCPFDLRRLGIKPMADWVNSQGITVFHSVPTIFEQLTSSRMHFPSVRLIRLEGDQMFPRHFESFRNNFGRNCVLVNGLASTETGIIRQMFLTHDTVLSGQSVPAGFGTEDMHIRILDDCGNVLPVGEAGEVAVQSRYIAEGYWNRPELTRRKFLPDPVHVGSRIYLSGDTGRLLKDGSLEFLGRTDTQIKIRGQWVDTGLVEQTLEQVPGIRNGLVAERQDSRGRPQLIAYLVATRTPVPTIGTIREKLGCRLPDIMLPARYVYLDELPLDSNCKMDRGALPAPDRKRPSLDTPYARPQTEREQTIAACYRNVLEIETIGVNDDFFELGGDSLKATELSLLLEQCLGAPCSVDVLFSHRTVASLDKYLGVDTDLRCAIPLQSSGSRRPLFCLHNHSGDVFEYRRLAQLLGPDQPVFGVRSLLTTECVHLPTRLEDVAAAYVQEIRQIQSRGPYHLCGNCFGGLVAFEVAQQLKKGGERIGLLALIDTAFPARLPERLRRRLRLLENWQELSRLPLHDSIRRLWRKLARFSAWVEDEAITKFRRATPDSHKRTATSSDDEVRRRIDFHRLLERRYRPKRYPDAAILIYLTPRDNHSGWNSVCGEGLQLIQLLHQEQGSGNPHLVDEPFVRDLAELLSKQLKPQPP